MNYVNLITEFYRYHSSAIRFETISSSVVAKTKCYPEGMQINDLNAK
jgi:hypothetical protein